MFGTFNFERMNETDVRENIVAKLIGKLGFRHSTDNDVITEQILRYPRASLGRKKEGDPVLRGKADYILEAERKYRWTAEAKSPAGSITSDDIEQAYTYAYHPEVRAVYFLVTNGREFLVFRTVYGPGVSPVLRFGYSDLQSQFQTLENILSPSALKRDFPDWKPDTGRPLAAGLRSFAKAINGSMTISQVDYPPLNSRLIGLKSYVREGSIERAADGGILVYLKFGSSHAQMDQTARDWGLEMMEFTTPENEISTDPIKPTLFSSVRNWRVEKGSRFFVPQAGQYQVAPIAMNFATSTEAAVVLRGTRLIGQFRGSMKVTFQVPFEFPEITIGGEFEVEIS